MGKLEDSLRGKDPAKLYFRTPLKEDRGSYFVEYLPPIEDVPFATLTVVTLSSLTEQQVAVIMEKELGDWTGRYNVPVMVMACDKADDPIRLETLKGCDSVIGWRDSSGVLEAHWRLLKNEEFPNGPFTSELMLAIYGKDFAHKAQAQVDKDVIDHVRTIKFMKWVVIVWWVAVPAIVIILGVANAWVGYATAAYGLWKAFDEWRKLTGRKRKSERELAKEKDDLQMKQHHYYCVRNPDGFSRLKAEVLDLEIRENLQKEVEEMRRNAAK